MNTACGDVIIIFIVSIYTLGKLKNTSETTEIGRKTFGVLTLPTEHTPQKSCSTEHITLKIGTDEATNRSNTSHAANFIA